MNANWNQNEDYFIRLKPIIDPAKKLKQDDIEQQLVINLMQLINAHHVAQPTRKLPIRVSSYGSYEQAKIDVLKEMRDELVVEFNIKRIEKWQTKTNEERIKWSEEINEIAGQLKVLDGYVNKLQKK